MGLELGTYGAWFNQIYGDDARAQFAMQAEALGYTTAWFGMGRGETADLMLIERVLDATSTITIATAIVNMWTNEAREVARSYRRISAKHPDRLLLGVGVGHPESIVSYRSPVATMAAYLDALEAGGVPRERRILAALGPRALRLARDRSAGTHPYLVVPDHTIKAREVLGPRRLLAPQQAVVVGVGAEEARALGRAFVANPYLNRRNFVDNLLRHGFNATDVAERGTDRLIDALVLHGTPNRIRAGLRAHLRAGASHVAIQVLVPPGESPMAGYRALASVLF